MAWEHQMKIPKQSLASIKSTSTCIGKNSCPLTTKRAWGFSKLKHGMGEHPTKNHKQTLVIIVDQWLCWKIFCSLTKLYCKKISQQQRKNKKKGVGALSIYLGSVLLRAAMINSSSFFLIFFNNSSLLCQC